MLKCLQLFVVIISWTGGSGTCWCPWQSRRLECSIMREGLRQTGCGRTCYWWCLYTWCCGTNIYWVKQQCTCCYSDSVQTVSNILHGSWKLWCNLDLLSLAIISILLRTNSKSFWVFGENFVFVNVEIFELCMHSLCNEYGFQINNTKIYTCYTFKISTAYAKLCVCSLCYIISDSSKIVQSALDINWDVLTEHKATWAGYLPSCWNCHDTINCWAAATDCK
jgi:hypothetical protein